MSAQVNQIFTQTLGEVALDTASSIGDVLSSPTAVSTVSALDTRVQTVASRLRTAADSAQSYASLAGSSLAMIDSTSALVAGVGSAKSSATNAQASARSGASDGSGCLGVERHRLVEELTRLVVDGGGERVLLGPDERLGRGFIPAFPGGCLGHARRFLRVDRVDAGSAARFARLAGLP